MAAQNTMQAMDSGAKTARQSGPAESREIMENLVSNLHDVVSKFTDKLSPVLRSEVDAKNGPVAIRAATTEMHAWLNTQIDQLTGLHARLTELQERVEI